MTYSESILLDYYKANGKTPLQFVEQTIVDNFKGAPERAVERIKKKGQNIITSGNWDTLDAEAHRKAFTIANVMRADILQAVYDELLKAQEDGTPLKEFQDNLLPRLEKMGWTGANPHRLKVIYETNLQIAYGEGRYRQQVLTSEMFPDWEYFQIQRNTKRPEHAFFHGKIFKWNDPIWSWLYPPSKIGCGCKVVAREATEKVESGEQYMDKFENNKEFNISPLKAWEPDTKKYSSGIKSQLEKMLKKAPKEEKLADKHMDLDKIKEHEAYIDELIKDRPDLKELILKNKDKVSEWLNSSRVTINIPTKNIFDILDNGYKTQFETKKSTGLYDPKARLKIEKEMFNYEYDENGRPIYAYLANAESGSVASQYGFVKLTLSDDMINSSTLTGVDSLFGYSPAYSKENFSVYSLLNIHRNMDEYDKAARKSPLQQIERNLKMIDKAKSLKDLNIEVAGAMGYYDYIEAQVHKKVTADDIVEIRYRRDEKELFNPLTKSEEIENYDLMVLKCKTSKKILIDDHTGKVIVGKNDWVEGTYENAKSEYYKKKKEQQNKSDGNKSDAKIKEIKRKIAKLQSDVDKHNAKIKEFEEIKAKDASKTAESNFYIKKENSLRDLTLREIDKFEKLLKDVENGTNS